MEQTNRGAHHRADRPQQPPANPFDPAYLRTLGLHPAVLDVLRYFTWQHLPPHLRAVSEEIGTLAFKMATTLPSSPQLTIGLQRLLDAKDSLVRAALHPSDHGWHSAAPETTPSDLPRP